MKKVLPVSFETDIMTQCDLFQYLCIAQMCGKNYYHWSLTHFTFGLNENHMFQFYLNKNVSLFYRPVLDIEIVSLNGICRPEDYVAYLKNCILRDYYIILYSDMNDVDITKVRAVGDIKINQILIMGYDDSEGVFYTPMLDINNGKYKCCKIPYHSMRRSYLTLQYIFRANADAKEDEEGAKMIPDYQSIHLVLPVSKSCPPPTLEEMTSVLINDLNGVNPDQPEIYGANFKKPLQTGLPAVELYVDSLKKSPKDCVDIRWMTNISQSLGRLHEYGALLLKRLKYYVPRFVSSTEKKLLYFEKSIEKLNNCYALAYKSIYLNQYDVIGRIIKYLYESYSLQKEMLADILESIHKIKS